MEPRTFGLIRFTTNAGVLLLLLVCCAQTTNSASVAIKDKHPAKVSSTSLSSSALAEHTVPLVTTEISTTPPTSRLSRPTEDTTWLSDTSTRAVETPRQPAVNKEHIIVKASTSRVARSTTSESTEAMSSASKEQAIAETALTASSSVHTQSAEPAPAGVVERTTTGMPERSKFLDDVRATIKRIMSTMGTGFTRQLLQADVSAECSIGVLHFMRAAQELEPWALRLVDASAKYPSGLLQASLADLGAYDECIETVVRDEYGGEKVRGQYCNVHVSLGSDRSFVGEILPAFLFSHHRAQNFTAYVMDERLPGLRLGVCFINSCSEQDLANIGRALVGNVATIKVTHCVTNKDEGINRTQAWIIASLAVLATMIVAATAFELTTENWDKKRKSAVLYKCAIAFSALSNTRLILSVNKDKTSETYSYRFMHGIRFLSIFWICLGHSYGTITENITRLVNALHYFERWETLIVTAGYLAVDSFFFFSGFLLYYTLNKQKQNRFVVAVVAVIRRFIRATVPMFFMIMCMYLLPLIASGPNSKEFYEKFYTEIRKHWWDLLFQLRNWRANQEVSTLPHLWYLSADYQFFLVAIVVIQVFRSRKWLVAFIFTALSLISCAIAAWQIYGTHMTPFLIPVSNTYSTVIDTLNYYYLLPFYHGVCFFSGCITFLLVERYGKAKIPRVIQASLWCICLFCGLYCLFMKIEWYRSNERASEIKRLFYAFTDRIFWSVCVAWFVFTCATGRGGIVNRFLSWNGFVPLSRLSFGVYLIHSPFYIVLYHIARERIFFSHFTLVSQCFSVFVWSYILSYFLFIACDAPTGHLEKMLFMRDRQKDVARNATQNGAHHIGAANNAKDLPIGVIEDGTIRNYFNGVPPAMGAGLGAGCDGACTNKCCRL